MQAPRTQEAVTAAEAATAVTARRSVPTGVWGVLILICTETTLIGCMVASYFYLRFTSVKWPPTGIEAPSVALPIALTGALILTTVPMFLATAAARQGARREAWLLIALAFAAQCGYLAVQIVSYVSDLHKFSIDGSAYGSIYFTMLGTHHAHVALGLVANLWLLAKLSRGLTGYRITAVRVVSYYWYFVAAIAIAVTFAQVSPS
jgi:heme/copper-type cytochrome/quinol oxidase subunit 3